MKSKRFEDFHESVVDMLQGFLRALKKLDQKFGRMYVDFGEPISAKNFFGSNLDRIRHSNVAPYLQKLSKNEIALIKELGFEVWFALKFSLVELIRLSTYCRSCKNSKKELLSPHSI